jgi:hypothetical protein
MDNRFPGIKGAVWRSLQNADAKGAMREMETAGPKGRRGCAISLSFRRTASPFQRQIQQQR